MTNLILTIAFLLPMPTQVSEERCLAKIIFAESRGESIEGAIAVGQATVNRAKRTGKAICPPGARSNRGTDAWPARFLGRLLELQGDLQPR